MKRYIVERCCKEQLVYLFQLWLQLEVRLASLDGDEQLGKLEIPLAGE